MIIVKFCRYTDNHSTLANLHRSKATSKCIEFVNRRLDILLRIRLSLGIAQLKLGLATRQNRLDFCYRHDTTVSCSTRIAHFSYLDSQLIVKVSHTQNLSPKALFGEQRIHSQRCAHLQEALAKGWIVLDFLGVLFRKIGELDFELFDRFHGRLQRHGLELICLLLELWLLSAESNPYSSSSMSHVSRKGGFNRGLYRSKGLLYM
mmetsp:Transcript_31434/g.51891  ORF Transcript_31434/g.51891 Transcript_31434/m.51891 type:complete len:205 (+) Transcript_31434:324-938(+)